MMRPLSANINGNDNGSLNGSTCLKGIASLRQSDLQCQSAYHDPRGLTMTPRIPAIGDMPKDLTANANNVLEAYVSVARCAVTDDVYNAKVTI